jgi:hypothetical protein
MPIARESNFRVIVECEVEVPDGDMPMVLAKVGKHLKTAPYVTRINHVGVTSHAVLEKRELAESE